MNIQIVGQESSYEEYICNAYALILSGVSRVGEEIEAGGFDVDGKDKITVEFKDKRLKRYVVRKYRRDELKEIIPFRHNKIHGKRIIYSLKQWHADDIRETVIKYCNGEPRSVRETKYVDDNNYECDKVIHDTKYNRISNYNAFRQPQRRTYNKGRR
jgi:hypothetical protein